ncbi:hypothetical protein [Aquimarina sp. I32.4]|uniref:hypothetical protein n=1 Tax=Aquimarina sp. I32.4 TaxID=2053903 RepID=UPI000CDF20FE|nr:hypothetical protein [Aquimarina sp. I32.4]
MRVLLYFLVFILCFSCKKNASKAEITKKVSIVEKNDLSQPVKKDDAIKEYPIEYVKIKPDSIKNDFRIDSIGVDQSIWIDSVQFIVGTIDDNKNGIHLLVLNKENKLLYRSKGQQDSWYYRLNFFTSKETDKIITVNETGAEESWGVDIYEYSGGIYKVLGSLDVMALNEYGESLSIIQYIKIKEIKNNSIEVSFKDDVKVYEDEAEKTTLGKDLKYRYEDKKLIKSDVQN